MADDDKKRAGLSVIQEKIKKLIQEFGAGEISHEQFNLLYERYSNRIAMIMDQSSIASPADELNTVTIREATAGKAIGLGVYHHRSGIIIETLGNFDVPSTEMSIVLNEFNQKIERGEFLEPRIKKVDSRFWVVFMARRYTTAIILFQNEPAPKQLNEFRRLLHDFEVANDRLLNQPQVEVENLARPFLGFVMKKLGK